jgi:paraquat-inducible protein A
MTHMVPAHEHSTASSTGRGSAMMLVACPSCGLTQQLPAPAGAGDVAAPPRVRLCCARCGATLRSRGRDARSNNRTAAVALAALILYPLAIGLPIIRIEQWGHRHESSVLDGIASLFAHGQLVIGAIVLLCSVVIPLAKLTGLLVLGSGWFAMRHRHRAMTYRLIELTGRWGMLDVLLVAVLITVLKLGDMVEVAPGPGAAAFTSCVVLSLLAAALFDPRGLWRASPSAMPATGPTAPVKRTEAGDG